MRLLYYPTVKSPRSRFRVGLLALTIAITGAGYARGEELQTKRLVALFEGRYKPARTLQATFLERYEDNGRLVRSEAGIAYFRRPGKMRWEYETPEKNLFLVDGKNSWFYVPSDHTVTRVPAKQSSDWRTPLALLAGEMKVSRVCSRVEVATKELPARPEDAVLSCLLKGEQPRAEGENRGAVGEESGADQQVFFEIVRSTGDLVRIIVRQAGGIQVEFRFADWKMDPPIGESMFHFEPPSGVAIVNGELPERDIGVK